MERTTGSMQPCVVNACLQVGQLTCIWPELLMLDLEGRLAPFGGCTWHHSPLPACTDRDVA